MLKMAFILFDGITFLDFAGFYDVIYRLGQFAPGEGLEWDICGVAEEVTDELGLTVKIGTVLPDLSQYDLVFLPGGMGTRRLRTDESFLSWLREPPMCLIRFLYAQAHSCWEPPDFWRDAVQRRIPLRTICWRPIAAVW